MAQDTLRIHPSVDAVIKPIIYEMTKIDIAQTTDPIIGSSRNEPEQVKEIKKRCVHIIYDKGNFRLAVHKDAHGDYVCRACGRKINAQFDETAVKKITDAIEVINQLLLFGMLNGLKAEPIDTLISLKATLPAAAQLMKELNEYIKRDNKAAENAASLGSEFNIPSQYRGITQYNT